MSMAPEPVRREREMEALRMRFGGELPVSAEDLPVKALAAGIAERGKELGLTWQLVPATVSLPGDSGEMRVVLDGDSTPIPAVSMIGRLARDSRVFVIISPPAGVHIVGFLGYDFPPSLSGEAVGRSRMITLASQFDTTSATAVNVTGMTFTAAANAAYEIRFRGSPAAAAADDYRMDWSVPSGAAMQRHVINVGFQQSVNDVQDISHLAMGRFGNSFATLGGGITAAGGSALHVEDNYLKVGATGGAVQLRFWRSAASGGTVSLRADAYMVVQRFR